MDSFEEVDDVALEEIYAFLDGRPIMDMRIGDIDVNDAPVDGFTKLPGNYAGFFSIFLFYIVLNKFLSLKFYFLQEIFTNFP